MSDVKRDIEAALFGSPLGAVDMIAGLVLMLVGLISFVASAFKKRGRRG